MRNLQYKMKICQKTHNKVTMKMSSNFHFCQLCQFPEIHEYLGIELWYRHLVYLILKALAWEICNMKWEFVKKLIKKSQWQCQVTFIFANFVNFLKSMKSYLPAFLWISLDRTIVPAPSMPHFKGLGMRNLQYEISIYQKIDNKATMAMSSYFDFCWLRRYKTLHLSS